MKVTSAYGDVRYEMTDAQIITLALLCSRYGVVFVPQHYTPQFDLPEGYLGGWVGGPDHARGSTSGKNPTIYIGVSAEGDASS